MRGLLFVSSIFLSWALVAIFLIFGVVSIFGKVSQTKNLDLVLASASRNIFSSPSRIIAAPREILSAVNTGDGRVVLVDNFLQQNGSPMTGMGKVFIEAADKYNLDWKLLPAIAYQESSLGKKTPYGSYNAFGWGVVDGSQVGANFANWQDAIFTVAQGLRVNYLDKGLKTPETINPVYASDKNWGGKIRLAMEELTQ